MINEEMNLAMSYHPTKDDDDNNSDAIMNMMYNMYVCT